MPSRRDVDSSRFDALFIDRGAMDRERAARESEQEAQRKAAEWATRRAAERLAAVEFVKEKVAEFAFSAAELGLRDS